MGGAHVPADAGSASECFATSESYNIHHEDESSGYSVAGGMAP